MSMIPPSLLLQLGKCPDVPKSVIPNLSNDVKPLDNWDDDPYIGEIRCNIEDYKCYKYTENGWKEIK